MEPNQAPNCESQHQQSKACIRSELTIWVNPKYDNRSIHGSPRQSRHFLFCPRILFVPPLSIALSIYLHRLDNTSAGFGSAWPSNLGGSSATTSMARSLTRFASVSKVTHSSINLGCLKRMQSFAEHFGEEH